MHFEGEKENINAIYVVFLPCLILSFNYCGKLKNTDLRSHRVLLSAIYVGKWIKTHQRNESSLQNEVKSEGKQNDKLKTPNEHVTHLRPFIESTSSFNWSS